jgi:outer membrane protein TolC
MPIRPSRLAPLALFGLLQAPLHSAGQDAPPAPQPAPDASAPAAVESLQPKQERPIEEFDLHDAIITEGSGLTADDVAQRTLARSYQVESARSDAASAEANADATWTNVLPTVTLFAQYKRIKRVRNNLEFFPTPTEEQIAGFNPGTLPVLMDLGELFSDPSSRDTFTQPENNYSIGAELKYPVSDLFLRIWPGYEASAKAAEAKKIGIEATEAQIELQAREAFYNYARAVAFRAVAEQAFRQAEAQTAQVELFVRAGTAAPVELALATSNREKARGDLARATGLVSVTRTVVATLSGMQVQEVSGVGEDVTVLPAPPTRPIEELVSSGLSQRAELRALRKAIGASELGRTAEKNGALPSLILEGTVLYANPNPRYIPPVEEFNTNWEVGATLAWTPNQWLSSRQKGKKADADVAKLRSDMAALEDGVRLEVVQAYQDYYTAQAAAAAAESALKASEEAYRVRMAQYRVGAGVVQDLLDADLLVNQARLGQINAALDARVALARLERAAALE